MRWICLFCKLHPLHHPLHSCPCPPNSISSFFLLHSFLCLPLISGECSIVLFVIVGDLVQLLLHQQDELGDCFFITVGASLWYCMHVWAAWYRSLHTRGLQYHLYEGCCLTTVSCACTTPVHAAWCGMVGASATSVLFCACTRCIVRQFPYTRSTVLFAYHRWCLTMVSYASTTPVRAAWYAMVGAALPNRAHLWYKLHGMVVCVHLEGPAHPHIQALNLTEGMCAPAVAWLAWCKVFRRSLEPPSRHGLFVVSRFVFCQQNSIVSRFVFCQQILSADFSS